MKESRKDETFWAVLNAAIQLEFVRGHQRWTMSELSRMSKVTRSLIYYYFGKSKEAILLEAVKIIGEEFFGLTAGRIDLWQKGEIAESVLQSRRLLEKSPFMGSFYMVHREAETEIGEAMRSLEREYKAKLKRFFKEVQDPYRDALFGLLLGLVLTPRLSEDAVKSAVRVVASVADRPLK